MSKAAKAPKGVTLTPYQRLRDAAVRRVGMMLSAEDVKVLWSGDHGISAQASDDDDTCTTSPEVPA